MHLGASELCQGHVQARWRAHTGRGLPRSLALVFLAQMSDVRELTVSVPESGYRDAKRGAAE